MYFHSFVFIQSTLVVTITFSILQIVPYTLGIQVTVPANAPQAALSNVVDDNFLGISWELSSFDTLWGTSADSEPVEMQNYLRNIALRMSKPLKIRIGGNGMDGSTYVPNQPQAIVIQPNPIKTGSRPDDFVPVNFSSKFLDLLNGMADKVGEMEFSLGLTMRHQADFPNAALFGADAQRILGPRLGALLLGNEPDLYAGNGVHPEGYSVQDYVGEIGIALEALKNAGVTNSPPIVAGPTTCCNWLLKDVLDAGLPQYPYKYYTVQKYPNNVCNGVNPRNTNITYYLTHANVEDYLGVNSPGINQARQAGVPTVLSEFNSVACGGSNISDTFAATLWAIDVGLKGASLNYSSLFIHTREAGVQYNLFDPPSAATGGAWQTGSPYYSALFLSEVASENGSVVVDLNLNTSITNEYSTVAGYALYDKTGTKATKLVLLNMGVTKGATQTFTLPGGLADGIHYKLLTASEVTERINISWAGQTVGSDGLPVGSEVVAGMSCTGGCELSVVGPGALLVSLDEKGMFNTSSPATTSLSKGIATNTTATGDAQRWVGESTPPYSLMGTLALFALVGIGL